MQLVSLALNRKVHLTFERGERLCQKIEVADVAVDAALAEITVFGLS